MEHTPTSHSSRSRLDFSKAFATLSLFRTGPPLPDQQARGKAFYSAKFELDGDISELFPYLNAEVSNAQFYSKPKCIKFLHDEHLVILYSGDGAFTPVKHHADAVDFLQLLLELLSDVARRRNDIIPNFRHHTVSSTVDIFKLLPGTNCGKCGFATCLAFAAALSREKTSLVNCPFLPTPIEEQSTFRVADRSGCYNKTISLALNHGNLYEEVRKQTARLKELQARLADFENERSASLAENNAKLISPLTTREIDVLRLVAYGSTNKEISTSLNISEHTVKSHVIHIFYKLGVNDRTQASVWAAKNGLV